MFTHKRFGKIIAAGLLLLICSSVAGAQQRDGISDTALAELTNRAMSEFSVPGMAVGIIKADKVLLANGYGVREVGKTGKIDSATLFKIASNSKAFTTAALAVLNDDGLVSWDGLVIDYIPEFRMHDPWVTAGFTVTEEAFGKKEGEVCCVPGLSQFAGRYRDPWFGDVIIRLEDGQLHFSAEKSPKLEGVMRHNDGSRFVVRWVDRWLEADAYVLFERGQNDRVVGISMTKLDPGDFDFEDLNLSRVE